MILSRLGRVIVVGTWEILQAKAHKTRQVSSHLDIILQNALVQVRPVPLDETGSGLWLIEERGPLHVSLHVDNQQSQLVQFERAKRREPVQPVRRADRDQGGGFSQVLGLLGLLDVLRKPKGRHCLN